MSRILVTGATGFMGRALCRDLISRHHTVLGGIRESGGAAAPPEGVTPVILGDLADLSSSHDLGRPDIIVHTAGLAHVLGPDKANASAFERANVTGTRAIARAAHVQGVRRLVFISSIGVHGSFSGHRGFHEDDPLRPETPYARSKVRAEAALREEGMATGLEVVVLRPPLVYGPAAPGNFARLVRLVARGLPLPFASIRNQRSFVSIGNLTHAIERAATHPAAAGQVFLVADPDRLSTPSLIRLIASSLGRPSRLMPCPVSALELGARLLGRLSEMRQLTRSLVVHTDRVASRLGWSAPYTVADGVCAALANRPE